MKHELSEQEIKELEEMVKTAVPYADDDPIWGEYDGEYDSARASASLAKKLLDEYNAEKSKDAEKNDMTHDLSKQEIKELKGAVKRAVPYADDDPIWNEYDGEHDSARVRASFAKRILEQYATEQAQEKDEL